MILSNQHTRRDKALLRLERELNRLYQAHWNAPIVPLEHPYQKGWVKSFVIARKAERHPEIDVFRTVLRLTNHTVYSRNPGFLNKKGQAIGLHPKVILPWQWDRLAWPASHQRLFAYGSWRLDEHLPWNPSFRRSQVVGFKLIRTWWLEEDVQPHMITHQRVDLPEVRSRIAEIENHFSVTQARNRLRWLHGQRQWWNRYCSSSAELRDRERCEPTLDADT